MHIRSSQERRYKLLLDVIRRIDTEQVEYFILLGDIFDFVFGRQRYFYKKFQEFFEALETLASKGNTRVLYFQGNHEFSLERFPWRGVEVITEKIHLIPFQGVTLAFSHGDYLLEKKEYLFYMGIVRSESFQNLACLCPGFLMDRICLKLAHLSRQKQRPFDSGLFEKSAKDWVFKSGGDIGIVGHFHRKEDFSFLGEKRHKKLYFVDSWKLPQVVTLSKNLELQSLPLDWKKP